MQGSYAAAVAVVFCACGGGTEVAEVPVSVRAELSSTTAVTDLGFTIELDAASMSFSDFEFLSYGARETAWLERLGDWFVSSAHAHPGHVQDGDTLGVMPGRFVIDFFAGESIGDAVLLASTYDALDVTFSTFATEDGLASDDARIGLSIHLSGRALRDGQSTPFEVHAVAPTERKLVGVPFETEVVAGETRSVVFSFATSEPFRPTHHLFDGVDFAAMPGPLLLTETAEDPAVVESFFSVQRRLLSHDFFEMTLEQRQ
ncbi:MAG: hypothetical protein AAF605_06675 [Myxococcota bacterium]